MRLSEEQVKQGILHSDSLVRSVALEYFADAFSRNSSVMPVAIEALERFGAEAFRSASPIANLAQTPETIQWAIGELQRSDDNRQTVSGFYGELSNFLYNADPELIAPHEAKILDAPRLDGVTSKLFRRRLRAFACDADACWRQIEAICEAGRNQQYAHEAGFSEAIDYARVLARQGERHADRMMALLEVEVKEYENNPMVWMEPLLAFMAGEMRYEPAIPLLVAKLHQDQEVLSEECRDALIKIGADSAIERVGREFPASEWPFRLFASSVLGCVHSDAAVETCRQALQSENDDEIREYLATSLAMQFSEEGNQLAREVLLEFEFRPFDLKEFLVASCTLLGQELPELSEWRQELNQVYWQQSWRGFKTPAPAADAPRRVDNAAPPTGPLRSHKTAGRNDPCPCGSGKKYKTCCLRQQAVHSPR